jgi:hypothetical protein
MFVHKKNIRRHTLLAAAVRAERYRISMHGLIHPFVDSGSSS